jgi:hypothetical protein
MNDHIFDFVGGDNGQWKVSKMSTVIGESIDKITHLKIIPSSLLAQNEGIWTMKGLKSNIRYAEKEEKEKLLAVQEGLGRELATFAALIAIRKNEAWWNLA